MFSWIGSLIKKILRLIGLGGRRRGIDIGAVPTITAPPVAGIPDSLRNAVRVALKGQQPASVEVDFGAIRPADLDAQGVLADIRLLKAFIANEPSKARELVSSAGDLRKAQEIVRQAGLEGEYQRGNLIKGAIALARIYSVGQQRRTLRTGETAPTAGPRTYFPLQPFDATSGGDTAFVGVEGGRIASALFMVETLVETIEETTVCLADAEIVETAIVERGDQFAQMLQNLQNDEQVRALVLELGLDEESVRRQKGGLGCLVILAIVVITVVVCAAIVFSDRTAKASFADVDRRKVLDRLATLPITTWKYRGASDQARHIGPTAQDFYSAFALGDDDRYISTVDASGVALAAIQGLNDLLLERDAEVEQLKARLAAVETVIRQAPSQGPGTMEKSV